MAKQLYDYWFVQFDFPNEEGKPYKSSGGEMVWNEKLKRNMPKEWCTMTIGEVENNIITGKTPSCADEDNFGGDIPFITIDDIRGNFIRIQLAAYPFHQRRRKSNKKIPTEWIAFSFLHWYNRGYGIHCKIITNKPTD